MKCPNCGGVPIPEDARFCPYCGHDISAQPRPSTRITVDMDVGNVHDEASATGIDLGKVEGDASIASTVNQIENVLEQGDYVDRRTIINVLSAEAMQEVAKLLLSKLEVGETPVNVPGSDSIPQSAPLPTHARRQITEVIAAQKEMEAKGIPTSSEALYDLGRLAHYNRDRDQARTYFRQSYETNPENVAARRALEILDWEHCHYTDCTVIDLHAHPSLKVSLFKRRLTSRYKTSRAFSPFSFRTDFCKLQEGGVDVLFSTVYAPERGIVEEHRYARLLRYVMPFAWKRVFGRSYMDVTLEMLDAMEAQIQEAKDRTTGRPLARMVYSVRELDEHLQQQGEQPLAVIHNVEGAHSLDGKLENLERLFEKGVAYLTLAHFYENEAVHPCSPYSEDMQPPGDFRDSRNLSLGLKEFGAQVIEKMIELGMILDISHCTPPARRQIFDLVGNRLPIIASHMGVYEFNPSPRNLKDWEIQRVADSGGVVGVILVNSWLTSSDAKDGLDFVAQTLKHIINVAGIEHVAIGSDFDGFTDPPDDLRDAAQFPKLTQRLIAEDYSNEMIKKIWGENILRVLRQGWGKRD